MEPASTIIKNDMRLFGKTSKNKKRVHSAFTYVKYNYLLLHYMALLLAARLGCTGVLGASCVYPGGARITS